MESYLYGDFIRRRRTKLGLSQQDLAKVLQCSYQAISKYERNLVNLDLSLVSKLANILEVDVESFILQKEEKNNDYASKLSFDINRFKNRLIYLREKKEISQKTFAKEIGLQSSRISKIENGVSIVKIEEFIKMANYFGVSLTSFYYALSDEELKTAFNSENNILNINNKNDLVKKDNSFKKAFFYIPISIVSILILVLAIALPLSLPKSKNVLYDNFIFEEDENGYILKKYKGNDIDVVVPSKYNGKDIYRVSTDAFSDSNFIRSITFNDGLKVIDSYALSFSPNLKELFLPSTLEVLNSNAFSISYSLEKITLDENNLNFKLYDGDLYSSDMKILYRALPKGDKAKSVFIIPNGVERIYGGAFDSNYLLEEVNFPSTLNRIDSDSFIDCYAIKELIFNEGLELLELQAFDGLTSNVRKIFLPSTLKGFDEGNPFVNFPLLDELNISNSNDNFLLDNGILYSKDYEKLYFCPSYYKEKELRINELTQEVVTYAIVNNSILENIYLSSNIEHLQGYCIADNSRLNSVFISEGAKNFDFMSIYNCNNASIYLEADSLPVGTDMNFTDSEVFFGSFES